LTSPLRGLPPLDPAFFKINFRPAARLFYLRYLHFNTFFVEFIFSFNFLYFHFNQNLHYILKYMRLFLIFVRPYFGRPDFENPDKDWSPTLKSFQSFRRRLNFLCFKTISTIPQAFLKKGPVKK